MMLKEVIWFRGLYETGTSRTSAATYITGRWSPAAWSEAPTDTNVLTLPKGDRQFGQLRIRKGVKTTSEDRKLVDLVRGVKGRYVVTKPDVALRLELLLGPDAIEQHAVPGSVPVSVLKPTWGSPVIGAQLRGALVDLKRLLARFDETPGPGVCIAVDPLRPPRADVPGVRLRRVQVQWPLEEDRDADAHAVELVGELLERDGEIVGSAAGAGTWAVLQFRPPLHLGGHRGAVVCELPLALAGPVLRRLIAVAAEPGVAGREPRLDDEPRHRPSSPASHGPLLPRLVSRQLTKGATDPGFDAAQELFVVVPPLQALLYLPLDVLHATLRQQCSTLRPVDEELLTSLPASTSVLALTLGDGIFVSRRGEEVVVEGHGCTAVFGPDGRLRGGGFAADVAAPPGISDSEVYAWSRVDTEAWRLVNDGAAIEPTGAFLQVTRLIDERWLTAELLRRNVVEAVRAHLRGAVLSEGARPLVVVSDVADPGSPEHAAPDAVLLMGALRAVGLRVVYGDHRVTTVPGFSAWSSADGRAHAEVAFGGKVAAGTPTVSTGTGFVHRVDAHRKLVGTLTASVQLALALVLQLRLERTAWWQESERHDIPGEYVDVTDRAFTPLRDSVWPWPDGRVRPRRERTVAAGTVPA